MIDALYGISMEEIKSINKILNSNNNTREKIWNLKEDSYRNHIRNKTKQYFHKTNIPNLNYNENFFSNEIIDDTIETNGLEYIEDSIIRDTILVTLLTYKYILIYGN